MTEITADLGASPDVDQLFRWALGEDRARNDITCSELESFFQSNSKAAPLAREFLVLAKAPGVFSGQRWIEALSRVLSVETRLLRREGEEFETGDYLVVGRAAPLDILRFERTLLNGLQGLCGVATQTRNFVTKVEQAWAADTSLDEALCPGVFHTRKTTPLFRDLQLTAVLAGGGRLHRRDLSERVLVKENHKYLLREQNLKFEDFVDSILKTHPDALIEVENFEEAIAVVAVGAKHLMLDNFSPEAVRKALKILAGRVVIEISGGLNLHSIADYVLPGVQRLSVGALTHGAASIDLSLDWKSDS